MDERTTRNMLQQLNVQEQKKGIELVQELISQCQYQRALLECDSALGEKGKDYGYMLQRIRAVVLQGKKEAEKSNFFINQLKQAHTNAALKDTVFLEMNARHHLQSSSFVQAEKAVEQLIENVGVDSQIGRRFSTELIILAQRYADAERHLAEAQLIHPYDAAFFELRGDVLLKELDQTEQALEQFRFAMQMNKRNSSLYSKASAILFNKHFYSEAALHASVALEQLRSDIDAIHQQSCLLIRGTSYLNLKETDEALKDFQSLLDANEKCLPARIGKMKACLVKGKIDQVIAILKKAEELHGVQGSVSIIGCLQNLQSSSIVDSEKVYGQASEKEQEKIDFCEWMALAYFMRKDFDNCEIFLKKKLRRAETLTASASLLNYINYWYLQEPYAKASMEKSKLALDLKPLNLREIDMQIIEDLQLEEKWKSNFYEYLQQMILYVFTGLYRWYPQDLFALLVKHKENTNESRVFQRALVHAEKGMQQQEGKKKYQQNSNSTKVEERRKEEEEERNEIIIVSKVTLGDKQEEKTNEKASIQQENQRSTQTKEYELKKSLEQKKPLERSDKPDKIIDNESTSKGVLNGEKEDVTKIKEQPSNDIQDKNLTVSEKVEIITQQQIVQEHSQIKSKQEIVSSSQQNNHIIQPIGITQQSEHKEQSENLASDNKISNSNNDISASSSIQFSNADENQKEDQITENSYQQLPQEIQEKTKVNLTSENGKNTEHPSQAQQVQIEKTLVTQEQPVKDGKEQNKTDVISSNKIHINSNNTINNNCKEKIAEDLSKNEREQENQHGQIHPVNQNQNNLSARQVSKIPDSSDENISNKLNTNQGVLDQKEEEVDNNEDMSQNESNITKKDFQQQSFQSPEIVRPNSACCVIF